MVPVIILFSILLGFTLMGLYNVTRRMDRTENEFVHNTCFLEGMFFLIMFLLQLVVDTGLFVLTLPLIQG